jgi:hypothetical protein
MQMSEVNGLEDVGLDGIDNYTIFFYYIIPMLKLYLLSCFVVCP